MDRDLPPHLQVLGRDVGRPGTHLGAHRIVNRHGADLSQRDAMHQSGQRLERPLGGNALIDHCVCARHQSRALASHQGVDQCTDFAAIGNADHFAHGGRPDRPRAMRDGLIEERQCISHTACCSAANLVERFGLERNPLGLQHFP